MALSITQDIKPITELKRNMNAVIEQVHKTKRPVVLTVNGKPQAVLLDAKEYENITGALELLKSLIPAEKDTEEDQYQEVKQFLEVFARNNSI